MIMKICIIDIGSNSVRLAMLADGKTLYKRIETTRLGEGLSHTGRINDAAVERTVQAILKFNETAKAEDVSEIYAFATAAVRSAVNRDCFLMRVKQDCGIDIDVLSGEREAQAGLYGALKGKDGGIIDVGGASTEITVRSCGEIIYSKSVNVGAVRLFDLAGRNRDKLRRVIEENITEYGNFLADKYDMYAIGGTATTIASVKHGLKQYDPEIVDGTVISIGEISGFADRFLSLSVEKVKAVEGMDVRRADVIGGGCMLFYMIMERLGIDRITVSESDNIEGYYKMKEDGHDQR